MNFKFIDQLQLGISLDLTVLKRDSQRYSILLYQHEGVFFADSNRIGNANSQIERFDAFFIKARQVFADLVMTPEYSCPWQTITNIVQDSSKWPDIGKLWAVGCESVGRADILAFKENINQDSIIVFSEQVDHDGAKFFYDPLVYLFRVQQKGVDKLFVLIQFKTHHMGVWGGGVIERDNLIEGNSIYILKNTAGTSINLLTLICSEAINFPAALTAENIASMQWEDLPYLILNPQINPKPTYGDFVAFRNFVFRYDHKEIISLNWQIRTVYQNHPMIENNCSRSGFYLRSSELDLSRERITSNHKKGLYYFNNRKDRHTYLLSSLPHCFLVQNTPVKISNVQPAQSRRDGPQLTQIFCFNDQNVLEEHDSVNDEHINYMISVGCTNTFLLGQANCVLEKEMLVCLSTGVVDGKAETQWYKTIYLDSIIMDERTEINKRLTVARNTGGESRAMKTKFIEAVNELAAILNNDDILPSSLRDLKGGTFMLGYYKDAQHDKYRLNVVDNQGEKRVATIAYVGYEPDSTVEEAFSNLRKMFDRNTKERERVVVFYKRQQKIYSKFDPNAGKLTETNDYDDTSIFK